MLNILTTPGTGMGGTIIMLIAMVAIFYFLLIRPENKRKKEAEELRNSLKVGDEITTIGGIMGRVVTVKEDSLVIETGADRTKIKFARWAIQTNNTAEDRLQAERAAQAAAKEAEKAEKSKNRRSKKSDTEE